MLCKKNEQINYNWNLLLSNPLLLDERAGLVPVPTLGVQADGTNSVALLLMS